MYGVIRMVGERAPIGHAMTIFALCFDMLRYMCDPG